MAKFIFCHSRMGSTVRKTLYHEKWIVETEQIYIHTERGNDGRPSEREANQWPEPERGVVCFKIKVWGRAGWNS